VLFVRPKKKTSLFCRRGGFTIVELLVAAVLVLIAVAAVVSVVRTSTEMQVTDFHRRQARAAIIHRFEASFDSLRASNYPVGGVDGGVALNAGWVNGAQFELDDRGGLPAIPLMGEISYRIVSDTQVVTLNGDEKVGYHEITARVRWGVIADGTRDSVELSKRLAVIR